MEGSGRKKKRTKREQNFEYRVQELLEKDGWLVINVPQTKWTEQLFDLMAIKNQFVIPIEVKGYRVIKKKSGGVYKCKGYYSVDQRKRQTEAASIANTVFALIGQTGERGLMTIEFPNEDFYSLRTSKSWEALKISFLKVFEGLYK